MTLMNFNFHNWYSSSFNIVLIKSKMVLDAPALVLWKEKKKYIYMCVAPYLNDRLYCGLLECVWDIRAAQSLQIFYNYLLYIYTFLLSTFFVFIL